MADDAGLPPLTSRWLAGLLPGPLPSERRATCGDCAMRSEPTADVQFSSTKCCTYFPELPSFAIGGLLLDDDPALAEGRARVRARIADGQQVTPLGIGRPHSYLAVYGPSEVFGVAHALRCPYYDDADGGRCTVWSHREAVCSTWFCKHERGVTGFNFWSALRRLLRAVEQRLSVELAVELGVDREALDLLSASPHTLDRHEDPELFAAMWGDWAGRETAYFEACARAAAALAWDDVRARCGPDLDPLLAALRETHAELAAAPRLPELVRIRALRRAGGDAERTFLATYSSFDPIVLPAATADALHAIDGKPVAVVLDHGAAAGIDRPLLERLWEFGLLENASE